MHYLFCKISDFPYSDNTGVIYALDSTTTWSLKIQLACHSAAAQRCLLKSQETCCNASSAISPKLDVLETKQAYQHIHNKALCIVGHVVFMNKAKS